MSEPQRPLLDKLRKELGSLADEVRESIALRWELALLELQEDFRSAKRLAVVFAVSAVMALAGLPLLFVLAAELLDGRLGLARTSWLAIFGAVLLLGAALAGALTWRHFRRHTVGLEETLEELREDLLWLREKTGEEES